MRKWGYAACWTSCDKRKPYLTERHIIFSCFNLHLPSSPGRLLSFHGTLIWFLHIAGGNIRYRLDAEKSIHTHKKRHTYTQSHLWQTRGKLRRDARKTHCRNQFTAPASEARLEWTENRRAEDHKSFTHRLAPRGSVPGRMFACGVCIHPVANDSYVSITLGSMR